MKILTGFIERAFKQLDVFWSELARPIPDIEHRRLRESWRLDDITRHDGREDKLPKQTKSDAVPQSRQIDLGELERRRKLLEQLPSTVQKEEEYRTLWTGSKSVNGKLLTDYY